MQQPIGAPGADIQPAGLLPATYMGLLTYIEQMINGTAPCWPAPAAGQQHCSGSQEYKYASGQDWLILPLEAALMRLSSTC